MKLSEASAAAGDALVVGAWVVVVVVVVVDVVVVVVATISRSVNWSKVLPTADPTPNDDPAGVSTETLTVRVITT